MSLSEEEEVDSIEKKPQMTPSESELDEFFSAAEENIQKQFSNKYEQISTFIFMNLKYTCLPVILCIIYYIFLLLLKKN